MIIEGNKLTPDEGKWLYNGDACSDLVYLGKNASADEWWEVDEYIEPPIPEEDEEATAEDYEAALAELGVK